MEVPAESIQFTNNLERSSGTLRELKGLYRRDLDEVAEVLNQIPPYEDPPSDSEWEFQWSYVDKEDLMGLFKLF